MSEKISTSSGEPREGKTYHVAPPFIDVDILDEASSADPSIVDEDINVAKSIFRRLFKDADSLLRGCVDAHHHNLGFAVDLQNFRFRFLQLLHIPRG